MNTRPDLRILFPASFSDACFRTIRAIAQIADCCEVDLTIAHVTNGDVHSRSSARQELQSFFAEADHYSACRRILLEGDPLDQICQLAGKGRYDLVMIPASDRIGFPSLFRSSFRARLLKRCATPVWTIGESLDRTEFRRKIRTVTCLLDFDCGDLTHLRLAMSFAARLEASLRIVHVIEPVDEGTLSRFCFSNAPLDPEVAKNEIHSLLRFSPIHPGVDIAAGRGKQDVKKLLESCDSDVLFVGPGHVLGHSWLAPQLQSWMNKLPCPVICVDGAATRFRNWSFENVDEVRDTVMVPARQLQKSA